jgi:dsDNA-specific endonuclease/ATPase MutS2
MINQESIKKIQFDYIIKEVASYAIGEYSKEQIKKTQLDSNLMAVETKQQETAEARTIVDSGQYVPFMGLPHIRSFMSQVKKGYLLQPHELIEVADFLRSNRMIKNFFEKNRYQTPLLFGYSKNLTDFLEVEESIYSKIKHLKIIDDASSTLRKVRKQMNEKEQEIESKLWKFIRHPQNKKKIQESLVIKKEERYTIPIKSSYKNMIQGNIVEQSNKGTTVYVEPTSVTKLNEQLVLLKAEEQAEEYQILAELTGYVSEQEKNIMHAIEMVTFFDIIFARAKYSKMIEGVTPLVNKEERVRIIQGKHPLLFHEAVPLDFSLGVDYRGLVITGANAGGKTVVLKTVGLLTLMTMFGLQIPAQKGTEIAVLDQFYVDIGDQQNIENALSTFSGHMKNIADILKKAGRHTLVLLDEVGSGTEPNEGAGLAIAILENLYQKGSLVVATTHYGEIKRFAEEHKDFIPAAMAFDEDTFTPQYLLQVGKTGDSQALSIARKMNMSEALIQQAANYIKEKTYPLSKKEFSVIVRHESKPSIVSKEDRYQKGDRILLKESKEVGLVFADEGRATVQVLIQEEIQEVLRKRIELQASAQVLYPDGYDLDSLFVDFQTRKRARDLERGSKKARKELEKEARSRREQRKKE